MPDLTDSMKWLKTTFEAQMSAAIQNTPFSVDMLVAIAIQESFEVWGGLYKELPSTRLLELCVGDTIDSPGRTTFPTSKKDLLNSPNGDRIFAVARAALEDVGQYNAPYHKIAVSNPNKFCHGFGIFQYDIQFCREDPNYFLDRQWYDFDRCLQKCLEELKNAQARAGLRNKTELTDTEMAYVAIAYNAGSFKPQRGLKQGFKDQSGKYYGELVAQYMSMVNQA